jgi:alanyl-tRNA synthetase
MSSAEIRQAFLDFFKGRGHCVRPSASLVPDQDPSLMFVTAGMVPFKNMFVGTQDPICPTVASCQKCVRAGGKHNDLEEVGRTKRHHTFFEMLGNFSFGDYFKEQAIVYAWDLLTKVFGLPKDRLWVTVYHTDDQAFDLWKKVAGLQESRILRIATDDNFWSMGDTGPCGPCSEIFYDHGPGLQGGLPGTPDQDGDRYVELWNMVFMQYNQASLGHREDLPAPSIDTGMGLERIAAVMQGVSDNFDTDLFTPLIRASCDQVSGDGQGTVLSHRVIADHVRSSSFLIADGVMPSNEGRGYVLRRIMRRALRHVHHLGGDTNHLARISTVLVDQMRGAYPQLTQVQDMIFSVLQEESKRFQDLLNRGLSVLDDWIGQGASRLFFPGDKAFELYDTYGFPLDLTQDILRDKGLSVDEKAFDACMTAQKERSRRSWTGSGSKVKDSLWLHLNDTVPATHFCGYRDAQGQGTVQKIIVDGKEIHTLDAGQEGWVIVDRTPFYGESGGQMGDKGVLSGPSGTAHVLDTQKQDNLIVHHVRMEQKGAISVGESVYLCIDDAYRKALTVHHSATHLLHAALRNILGSHVMQKGSKVAADKLRFDFNHAKALTLDQIDTIECQINQWIRNNEPVIDRTMPQKEALDAGAMAFFGEKYGDTVRVVTMGDDVSKELCGGTHVQRTGDLGLFKIVAQSSVAAGIRRIEAVSGKPAFDYVQKCFGQMNRVANTLKTSVAQIEQAVDQMIHRKKQKEKSTPASFGDLSKEMVDSVTLWHGYYAEETTKDLKKRIDQLRSAGYVGVILLSCAAKKTVSFVVGILDDGVAAHYRADHLLRAMVAECGSGGGHATIAQGSSPDLTDHAAVVQRLRDGLVDVS